MTSVRDLSPDDYQKLRQDMLSAIDGSKAQPSAPPTATMPKALTGECGWRRSEVEAARREIRPIAEALVAGGETTIDWHQVNPTRARLLKEEMTAAMHRRYRRP